MQKIPLLLVCMSLLMLVSSACGSAADDAGRPVQSTMQAELVDAVTVDPTIISGEIPAATVLPSTAANATSTPIAPDAVVPTRALPVKTDLQATDPNSVALASGQVQLVEFFAFW